MIALQNDIDRIPTVFNVKAFEKLEAQYNDFSHHFKNIIFWLETIAFFRDWARSIVLIYSLSSVCALFTSSSLNKKITCHFF